jgi:PKD repeat protein
MAIGRISGPMLLSNLERQGVDLAIDSNVAYFNVTSRYVGINNQNPQYTLDVTGNAQLANLFILGNTISSATGKVNLGNNSNVVITGGSPNYILYTDGTGNLNWGNLVTVAGLENFTANNILLGTPQDGSLIANAGYPGWNTSTTVTNAIDNLNQIALNLGQNTFVGNAHISANIVAGPSPMTVLFTGTTGGNPNSYLWNFGDGNTSTAGNSVAYTYTNVNGGQYTVTYTAYNNNGTLSGNAASGAVGSTSTVANANYITLYTPTPIPNFTINAASINSSSVVSLTDTSQYASSYRIYWGDGTSYTNLAVGGSQVHRYNNTGGDAIYSITLNATSATAGPTPVTVGSDITYEKVYSIQTPVIVANVVRVVNWEANGGGTVGFTNSTATNPGSAAQFGAQQVYQYWWNDLTSNSNVAVGSTNSGDTGTSINHTYSLTDTQQIAGTPATYNSQLLLYTGYSTSPFKSSNITVIVEPSVRSNLAARANTVSNGSNDSATTGYIYTDYIGQDRALFTFTSNLTQNATNVNWTYGDGTTSGNIAAGLGFPNAANITHSYQSSSTGTKTVDLTSYGKPATIFQTNTKSTTITINAVPAAPAALNSFSLSMNTGSIGSNPNLAAGAQDNTNGNIVSAGSAVTRYTNSGTAITNVVTNANTSVAGTLTAYINRTNVGGIGFSTSTNTTGTYTNLVIAADQDYNAVDPTYPSYFYKVFSAYVNSPLTSSNIGYNDIHLTHTATGTTNLTSYVVDNVTTVPTLVTTGVTIANVATAGAAITYISSIPYYQSSGNIVVQGLQAYNWIGQTYNNTAIPFTIDAGADLENTTGSIVSTQTYTYSALNTGSNYLTSGIPQANTGNVIGHSYTFGNIYVAINNSGITAVGNITASLTNINGTSAVVSLPSLINVYSAAQTGLIESAIACTAGVANTTPAVRTSGLSNGGDTPSYSNITNYYNNYAWNQNSTIVATDEAVVRWGNLRLNTTNFSSGYLPAGPNLSAGGSRNNSYQYFRFVWQRPSLSGFTIYLTGQVSGFYIAAPGSVIDSASTLNGWLDTSLIYNGAGAPGSNVSAGGNGSNGCAINGSNVIVPGVVYNNQAFGMTFGTVSMSNTYANQCLLNIKLGPTDWITDVHIGP